LISVCVTPGAASHGNVSRPLPSIAKVLTVGARSAYRCRPMQGLEPCARKRTFTVLRGAGSGNAARLPGKNPVGT